MKAFLKVISPGNALGLRHPLTKSAWRAVPWMVAFVWLMDNVPFHQLIWEKSTPSSTHHWIHVAFKRTGINKQQVIHNLIKYPSK